mgnify:CR=1 FL=1
MKKYAVLTREPRCFLGSFDFSWEQRKLGELALFNPKDELPQTFEYVDLESVVGTEMLSHRTEVKSSAPSRAQRLAHTGDLFYQTVRPYQKNNYLFEKPDNNYVFSTGYAQMRPYVDGYFLLSLVQSERFVKVVLDNCTGTSYPAINANDLAEIEVAAPSDESEARKIGTIFRSIDNLITLHQRKCVFLFSFFRACISMNFTASTFSWEQRKAIDIADYSKGNGYSKGDLTDAGTPIILYGRLYTKYQFAISEVDTFAVPRNGAVYSQGNEVIVPASGETAEDIARASAVEKSGVMLGGDLNILRPFDFIIPLFLALAISNGEPQKELAKKAQGKSVVHIHNTDIQEVTIAYPSRTEQDRIVSVFRQLDNLITLHQRECISFTGSAGRLILTANKKRITSSWEQRKLGDIADIVGGGTPSTGNQSYWDGDIDWYAPAEIADQIYANSSQKKITGLGYENSSAKMLPPGTVLFTSRAGIGKTAILTRKGCTNQGFQSIVPHRGELDSYFIFSRTEELKRYGELVGAGSTFVEVSGKQMAVMELMMPPTMREQQTIGGFFQQLDHLITLHQRKPFLMKWRTSDANRNQTNRLVL